MSDQLLKIAKKARNIKPKDDGFTFEVNGMHVDLTVSSYVDIKSKILRPAVTFSMVIDGAYNYHDTALYTDIAMDVAMMSDIAEMLELLRSKFERASDTGFDAMLSKFQKITG